MDRFVIRRSRVASEQTDITSQNQQPSTSTAVPQTNDTPIDILDDNDKSDADGSEDEDNFQTQEKDDDETETSTNVGQAKKRKLYDVKYRENWKMNFKWLTQKNGKAYCMSCNKSLAGGKRHLKRHEDSDIHKKSVKKVQGTVKIDRAMLDTPSSRTQDQIKATELKLCALAVEHNLPFVIFEHLPKFICSLPQKDILKSVQCSRTKATNLIKDKMGPFIQMSIANTLKQTFFSVIIDETTDVSTCKCLVIVVRYFCEKNKKIIDSFFGLLELQEANADAIFQAVIGNFSKHDIPLKNIIGFASDNASVMMGQLNGVKAKFQEIIPNIFVIGCLSHSLHLCASKACSLLPNYVEDFTRSIYNYFAHSAKRQHDFKEYQQFVQAEPHKLLRPSQTRWLSLQAAVNRILQQWDALTLYFQSEVLVENVYGAKEILNALDNKVIKLYFYFLSHILKIVCKMNLEFQSESPRIHTLLPTIKSNYKMILKFYMKEEIVDNLEVAKINPKNPDYFKRIDAVYHGAGFEVAVQKYANQVTKEELHEVHLNCLNFYIKLCTEIRTRIDFSNTTLNQITNVLDVSNIFKSNKPSISLLAAEFPNIINIEDSLEDLNLEWRLLAEYGTDNQLNNLEDVITYLDKYKNHNGDHIFKNVLGLLKAVLSLPHSSAAAERVFSNLSVIKTKYRNKLKVETVEGLLFGKEGLKNNSCFSWEPSAELIKFKPVADK